LIRAVLDGNVYVSAIIQPSGPPGKVIDRFLRDGAFEVVLSPAIVEEILRAFTYPKVRKYIHGGRDPIPWFEDLALLTDMVAGDFGLTGVCSDPDDDKYLATAMEGRAGFVVTGDRRFLALKEHEGIRIVAPRTFLDMLDT
jgi:putative PIN family toxin of toxin-antitoxin system